MKKMDLENSITSLNVSKHLILVEALSIAGWMRVEFCASSAS